MSWWGEGKQRKLDKRAAAMREAAHGNTDRAIGARLADEVHSTSQAEYARADRELERRIAAGAAKRKANRDSLKPR